MNMNIMYMNNIIQTIGSWETAKLSYRGEDWRRIIITIDAAAAFTVMGGYWWNKQTSVILNGFYMKYITSWQNHLYFIPWAATAQNYLLSHRIIMLAKIQLVKKQRIHEKYHYSKKHKQSSNAKVRKIPGKKCQQRKHHFSLR